MTPIARALEDRARGLLTCLMLAIAVLGGIAALGAPTATPTARPSVGPSVAPAHGTLRALGRAGATSTPQPAADSSARLAAVETGRATTLTPSDRIALSVVRSSAQHGPLSQIVGDLPSRRGPPADPVVAVLPVDTVDAASAVEPSPAAARAPPHFA